MARRAGAVFAFCLLVVAARAVPASAQPSLSVSATVNDSAGDNNQTLEPGESAFLVVTISNSGDQDATTVAATLSTSTTGASVTDSGPKTYATVAAGEAGDQSFAISLDQSYACGNDVTFDVSITSDQGPSTDQVTEEVPCPAPALSVSKVSLTDATTHDAVTAAKVGETVDVAIQISNSGTADATNVSAQLSGSGANITQDSATYGTIAKGNDETGAFQFVPTVCPQADSLSLSLSVKSDQSSDDLVVEIPVDCKRLGVSFVRGTFDDRAGGNGDGVPQPGETGLVYLQFFNGSDAPITGITATLNLEFADVSGGPVTVPDIPPGESGNSATAFSVKIHDDAPYVFGPPTEPTAPEPSSSPEPAASGTTLIFPGCEAAFVLGGISLDVSQDNPFALEGNSGIRESGSIHFSSDQGDADFPIVQTAVCAETIERGGGVVAATGARSRLDLLWLAVSIAACGVVLRRVSLVRL